MEEKKKRNSFASLERYELKKAKEHIRVNLGEKTEAEFKAYGIHCNKKQKQRGFSPHELKFVEEQKQEEAFENLGKKVDKRKPKKSKEELEKLIEHIVNKFS